MATAIACTFTPAALQGASRASAQTGTAPLIPFVLRLLATGTEQLLGALPLQHEDSHYGTMQSLII
jgi:hypothetical protein